ncbi:hypothetical protein CDAR_499251 [Caerostris darwini]|uniref:Uncharacterized protein n=1 Tax=Caerostris darwini TaxID=1538125 RepID=A0AAV4PDI8_9ARAC|nr:hypothetical protein CDAR_499251 [Caerostris darwini]
MGFIVSKLILPLWSPAGYDVPDPATGLTPRQKNIVQSTWKIVRADAKKNGILLFMRYFLSYENSLILGKVIGCD